MGHGAEICQATDEEAKTQFGWTTDEALGSKVSVEVIRGQCCCELQLLLEGFAEWDSRSFPADK